MQVEPKPRLCESCDFREWDVAFIALGRPKYLCRECHDGLYGKDD